MGCCEVSRQQQNDIESQVWAFEQNLNFSSLNARDIDRLAHRFSTDSIISKTQFPTIIKELKIDTNSLAYNYIETLYDNRNHGYSAVLLTTLGIIFGFGTEETKLSLLFSNYDTTNCFILKTYQVQKLAEDVIFISFKSIVTFAAIKISPEFLPELIEYKEKLLSVQSIMAKYFTSIIMGEQIEITNEDFLDAFKKPELKCFLIPHQMRVYSKDVLKIVTRTANVVDIMMNEDVDFDKNLKRKLSLKISREFKKNEEKSRRHTAPEAMRRVKV
ncbi:hypothetical protein SteCoe_14506 [Stentor coeruleus]|uniref:Uncharacterized protein n=1 Tax=Stentor coeruleus TaxID=5963 RepID=A0A1R2C5T9_9CILI|nr:hypothetical protein SteCoe_14506 [Stentor coeruleus]